MKGVALGRVPDGIQEIEEAFRRLDEAFGNPNKIMSHTLKSLEDLGTLPPEKSSSGDFNFAKRIEWFLKLEVILAKIIELSKRSSSLAHEAFSSSTLRKLWARFPTNVLDKLIKVPGVDEVRLQGILDKIVQMREHTQKLDDECGANVGVKKKTEGAAGTKVIAELFFRPPQRYDECRICVHLSATGSTSMNLFENHL